MGTVQYIGTGTEKCWHREDWDGEWDAKAKVLVDTVKASGHPVVNPEPIYLKGHCKGHLKVIGLCKKHPPEMFCFSLVPNMI